MKKLLKDIFEHEETETVLITQMKYGSTMDNWSNAVPLFN